MKGRPPIQSAKQSMRNNQQTPGRQPPEIMPGSSVPVLEAQQLFQGFREVRILFCQEEYRLRRTKNQKLILTK